VVFLKSIVLTFAIVSVTLLTQLSPMLNYPSLGDRFSSCQVFRTNSIQDHGRSSSIPEYLSCLFSNKKPLVNKLKKHMKIKFRQSGGYAGLRTGVDLDINSLTADESTQLESLVKTSEILKAKSGRTENAADLINYEITIENQDGTHQINFDDLTLPETAIPLLDYLQERAKPIR
jgi:hypothetical protein